MVSSYTHVLDSLREASTGIIANNSNQCKHTLSFCWANRLPQSEVDGSLLPKPRLNNLTFRPTPTCQMFTVPPAPPDTRMAETSAAPFPLLSPPLPPPPPLLRGGSTPPAEDTRVQPKEEWVILMLGGDCCLKRFDLFPGALGTELSNSSRGSLFDGRKIDVVTSPGRRSSGRRCDPTFTPESG